MTNNLFTGYLDGAVVGTGVTNTDMDAHGGDIGTMDVSQEPVEELVEEEEEDETTIGFISRTIEGFLFGNNKIE